MIYPLKLFLNELQTTTAYDVPTSNYAFTREYVRFDINAEAGVNGRFK